MLAVMKDGVFAKAPRDRRVASARGGRDAPEPRCMPREHRLRPDAAPAHRAVAAGRRLPIAVFSIWALVDNTRLYLVTLLNGLTLASLYFIVASGFTLVFGLMRNVNLAHGSLYLLGGYVGLRRRRAHRLVDPRAGRGLRGRRARRAC